MAQTHDRAGSRRAKGPIALLGLVALLGMSLVLSAQAQEKEQKKPEEPAKVKPAQGEAKAAKDAEANEGAPYRLRTAVRLGYTRPGYPADETKKGAIIPIASTNYEGKILGATVYFMVLERVSDRDRDRDRERDGDRAIDSGSGDPWGTGLGDFDSRFVPGRNFDGGVSPRLDTRARYIYLYQLVNDRGLDPRGGVVPAALNTIRAEDVASFGLRLLVDPRYITSWGHFQGAGFTAFVKDRNQINQVRTAADGSEVPIRLAVSANPSINGELPQKKFTYRSPAYALGKMGKSLEVGSDVLNLKKSFNTEYLGKGVITAAFAKNELAAVEGGKEPNFVQVMYFTGAERVQPDLGVDVAVAGNAPLPDRDNDVAQGVFRVDWRGENFVKLGQQSVVYGFTTDLPPIDEPIGIADPEASMRPNGIRQVVADGNVTPAADPGTAPGTAPTPSGGRAVGGAMVPGGTMGTFGGMGGVGGGGGIGFPGGGIGVAPPPIFGGGGGFGGGTTGTNTSTTPPTQTQEQQGKQGQGTTITINNTLSNQQSQQQQQGQHQQQGQQQGQQQQQHGHGQQTHGVVPAPASLLLGLLGLPGLFFLRRRPQPQAA